MEFKKILVTGATGMLGRTLVREWSAVHEVTGISRRGDQGVIACDLSRAEELEELFSKNAFQLVVHAAAYSDVDGCERDPNLAYASNALATRRLAALCGKNKIPLIYVSTDYVFNGRKKSSYTETDEVCPINIYGMTKLEGEVTTKELAWVSAIVRTSWLFGPDNPKNFVNQITSRLEKESEIRVLADQKDRPTYTGDLTAALERIGGRLMRLAEKKPKRPISETYHVCNRGAATRYQMAVKIRDLLRLKNKRVLLADASQVAGRVAVRPTYAVMSTARYERVFKAPLRRWEAALDEYLRSRGGMDVS